MANNTRDSLAVIDISNPADPVFLSEELGTTPGTTLDAAISVFVSGNYAYVANFAHDSLAVIDIGGSTISNLAVGTAKVGNLSVDAFAQFGQGAYFAGGLGVQGGIYANQGGTFMRMGTTTPLASTTLAWGNSPVPPALSALTIDAAAAGVSDVFSLSHFATSSSASGIGTGILFNASTFCSFGCGTATTTATSTARIASILTGVSTSSPTSVLAFSTKNTTGSLTEWMRLSENGYLGIGTTSPWAQLSINPNGITGPAFVIGSSTATKFIVDNAGNVGIGTTSPYAKLSVAGSIVGQNFIATSTTATSTISGGLSVGTTNSSAQLTVQNTSSSGASLAFQTLTSAGVNLLSISENGVLTSGLSALFGAVNVNSGTTLSSTNNSAAIPLQITTIASGQTADILQISGMTQTGRILTIDKNGYIGIGTSTSFASLQIATTTGKNLVLTDSGAGANLKHWLFSSMGGNLYVGTTTDAYATSTPSALTILNNGNIGIGSTTPGSLLSLGDTTNYINFVNTGTSTISNNLHVKGTLRAAVSYVGDLVFSNGFRFVEGDANDPIQTLNLQNQFGSTTISVGDNGYVGIGTTTPNHILTVAGDIGATGFVNTSTRNAKADIAYATASSTEDRFNQLVNLKVATYHYKIEDQSGPLRLGLITEDVQTIAPEILSPDGNGIDLYKLATFTLVGVQALAAKVDAEHMRVTALEERVIALESGAVSTSSGTPIISTTSLASAFEGFGVLIQKGIAQFNTLVFRQLVASKDADGTSSAGSVQILTGNTVAQINNSLVVPSTKIFVTFNSQINGSWWVSDKATGSFRVVLSAPQVADVSFDYFLVQTEGQIATSTPNTVPSVMQSNGPDTVAPVITLIGDNPMYMSIGAPFVEPGVNSIDAVDGSTSYITYVDGVQQVADASSIDTSIQTNHIITYSATDKAGNSSTRMRSVIVGSSEGAVNVGAASSTVGGSSDTTPPVVTLSGAASVQIVVGGIFIDSGATATDNVDSTVVVNTAGTVDTLTAGLYTLTYSATDAAGNVASVSRVVTVAAAASGTATSTPSI